MSQPWLSQDQITLAGHAARMVSLRSFDLPRALAEVVGHLIYDWRLAVLWPLTTAACLVVVWRTVRTLPADSPADG